MATLNDISRCLTDELNAAVVSGDKWSVDVMSDVCVVCDADLEGTDHFHLRRYVGGEIWIMCACWSCGVKEIYRDEFIEQEIEGVI